MIVLLVNVSRCTLLFFNTTVGINRTAFISNGKHDTAVPSTLSPRVHVLLFSYVLSATLTITACLDVCFQGKLTENLLTLETMFTQKGGGGGGVVRTAITRLPGKRLRMFEPPTLQMDNHWKIGL